MNDEPMPNLSLDAVLGRGTEKRKAKEPETMMHSFVYKCRICKRQKLAEYPEDTPPVWLERLKPMLTCDECAERRQAYSRILTVIYRSCERLTRLKLLQLPAAEELEVKAQIRKTLDVYTKNFAFQVSKDLNCTLVWNEDFPMQLMEFKIITVQRYMRLARAPKEANTSHVTYFKDCRSLRQAYVLVGIIPEIDPSEVCQDSTMTPELRAEIAERVAEPGPGLLPQKTEPVFGECVAREPERLAARTLAPELLARASESPALVVLKNDVARMIERLKLMTADERERAKEILKPLGVWL